MEIDARKTHTQGPTPSETGLSPPNWLVRAVRVGARGVLLEDGHRTSRDSLSCFWS